MCTQAARNKDVDWDNYCFSEANACETRASSMERRGIAATSFADMRVVHVRWKNGKI